MENKLSVLRISFKKNCSTQYCLISMIENRKNTTDKGRFVAAILMDLSKAFDKLNHNFLIAKLGG